MHEYYFENLRKSGDLQPASNSGLAQALTQAYGGFDAWAKDFQAIGEMKGVGWERAFMRDYKATERKKSLYSLDAPPYPPVRGSRARRRARAGR